MSLEQAVARRSALFAARQRGHTTAFRLINADGDGMPGLAVDVYDRWLVAHLYDLTPAAVDATLQALRRPDFAGMYVKLHPVQSHEPGPQPSHAEPAGQLYWGEPAPEELVIHEGGLPFLVRLSDGLRTGIFLDMRSARARVRELSQGRRVLNLFAYCCAFSSAALAGGALDCLSVEVSKLALERGVRGVALLGPSPGHRIWQADVHALLARLRRRGDRFDLIVVDPPSYATTHSGRFRVLKDYPALLEAIVALSAPAAWVVACGNHRRLSHTALLGWLQGAANAHGRLVMGAERVQQDLDFPVRSPEQPQSVSICARLQAASCSSTNNV